MKKQTLFFLMLMVTSVLNAQLKVNTLGKIEIGSSPSTDFQFNLNGNSHLDGSVGIGVAPNSSYILNLSGNSYLNGYVGIGTAPSTTYKLNVSGKSSLGGDTYITGSVGIGTAPPTDGRRLDVLGECNFVGYNEFHGVNSFFGPIAIDGPGPNDSGCAIDLAANGGFPGVWLEASGTFSNDYLLVVDGDSYIEGQWTSSDLQLKNNVTNLDGKLMLSKITNLNGKKYEFKNNEELEQIYKNITSKGNEYSHKPMNLPKGERYGFIAQEIEKEFPELVKTDPTTNLKAVDYDGMIPILLQAIKEQQKQINTLNETVATLQGISETTPLSFGSPSLVTSINAQAKTEVPLLEQNAPNPFNVQTQIGYYLPSKVNNAQLSIYNLSGRQLRCIKLTERGRSNITIMANDLESGIYLYSLIVDGTEVSCKRMILTD